MHLHVCFFLYCYEKPTEKIVQVLVQFMGGLEVVLPPPVPVDENVLYVFVDNSNMYVHSAFCILHFCILHFAFCILHVCRCRHIGAQKSHTACNGGGTVVEEPVHIVHVKYPELVRRVENGRECRRRFVGGVMPDIVARHWRELRYDVRSGAQVPYVLNITATPPARNQSALASKLGN